MLLNDTLKLHLKLGGIMEMFGNLKITNLAAVTNSKVSDPAEAHSNNRTFG